jgi:hypothetical protein
MEVKCNPYTEYQHNKSLSKIGLRIQNWNIPGKKEKKKKTRSSEIDPPKKKKHLKVKWLTSGEREIFRRYSGERKRATGISVEIRRERAFPSRSGERESVSDGSGRLEGHVDRQPGVTVTSTRISQYATARRNSLTWIASLESQWRQSVDWRHAFEDFTIRYTLQTSINRG